MINSELTAHLTHIVPLLLFLFSSFSSYTFSLSSSSSSSSSSHPLLPPRIAAVGIPRRHHYRCRRCEKGLHRPGIEPGPPAVCYPLEWQASILPLNHRCDVLREGIFSYIFVQIWKSDFFIKQFLCVKKSGMFAHSLTWDLLKWHLIEEKKKK